LVILKIVLAAGSAGCLKALAALSRCGGVCARPGAAPCEWRICGVCQPLKLQDNARERAVRSSLARNRSICAFRLNITER
jgi:hypothetical protein